MLSSVGRYPLLTAATATGAAVYWPGGTGVFTVTATTFPSDAVRLEYSINDKSGPWLPVDRDADTHVTLSANGGGQFVLPECYIRAAVLGTGAAAVTAVAQKV